MNKYLFVDSYNTTTDYNAIQRLEQIDATGTNCKDLFVASYINFIQFGGYLIKNKYNQTFASKAHYLFDSWQKGELLVKNVKKSNDTFGSQVMLFCLHEKTIFKKSNQEKKIVYFQFLEEHLLVFEQLDIWMNNKGTRNERSWSERIALDRMPDFPELNGINQHLNEFLDAVYLQCGLHLIEHFEWPTSVSCIADAYQEHIVFTQLLHPKPSLTTEQNHFYQQRVQHYLKKQLKEMQQLWKIKHPFEPFESIITTIAEAITPKRVEKPFEFKFTLPQLTEKSYPKHIFKDFKAFLVFDYLAKGLHSFQTISFFFRTMSESELPPLIVVKDTPFRMWFNEQDYEIDLNRATDTKNKAYNEERDFIYQLVKHLIYSNSQIIE